MTTKIAKPQQKLNTLLEQAERLIAEHIMGWDIRPFEVNKTCTFYESYFIENKKLGDVGSYEFHPGASIQDAFWVMDTMSAKDGTRFEIESDRRYKCKVTAKTAMQTITGDGATVPVATVQMALDVIAHNHSKDEALRDSIYQLADDIYKTEQLTLETAGDGLAIDLTSYFPS